MNKNNKKRRKNIIIFRFYNSQGKKTHKFYQKILEPMECFGKLSKHKMSI